MEQTIDPRLLSALLQFRRHHPTEGHRLAVSYCLKYGKSMLVFGDMSR